jgi:molybdate transport system substrate-binding protein
LRRAALVIFSLLLAGCRQPGPVLHPASNPDLPSGEVSVLAAASLAPAFKAEVAAFASRHNKVVVRTSFGGSAALAAQLVQGAPADVFASADRANMDTVKTAGELVTEPRLLARNRLEIVVAPGNPRGIRALADLAGANLAVVLCAPAVPCGNYARQALGHAGVSLAARSLEQDVSAVVSRVRLGEADAGIAYATDVQASAPAVTGVPIPDEANVAAQYFIATTRGGSNPGGGSAFSDFVLSPEGQGILARFGFSAA